MKSKLIEVVSLLRNPADCIRMYVDGIQTNEKLIKTLTK